MYNCNSSFNDNERSKDGLDRFHHRVQLGDAVIRLKFLEQLNFFFFFFAVLFFKRETQKSRNGTRGDLIRLEEMIECTVIPTRRLIFVKGESRYIYISRGVISPIRR